MRWVRTGELSGNFPEGSCLGLPMTGLAAGPPDAGSSGLHDGLRRAPCLSAAPAPQYDLLRGKNQTFIRSSWSRMRKRQGGRHWARHAPERLIPSPGRVTPAMFLASPCLSPHNPTSHNEVVLLALKVLKFSALRPPGLIQCG